MINVNSDLVNLIRASQLFDEDWYLETYPDVKQAGIDPISHYLWLGSRLGRAPSPEFNARSYLLENPEVAVSDVDPFVHFVTVGQFEVKQFRRQVLQRQELMSPAFAADRKFFDEPKQLAARIIAFHLPQFHQFEENDNWWGSGFTEWSNVRPAKPKFLGHYQPHEPHPDIGYYDLTAQDAFAKQIELAKSYGIFGFCFYYYWFGGKRLMQKAIESYLANDKLDHPFCLCWANENWTRRWDGMDTDILIAQEHSPEDDLACIADLSRYIMDNRYIRINGRPLVLVYRPSLLPDPAATASRWRDWCRVNGIGEIYLAYTQSFEQEDPRTYGFDAAIEFPPNNSGIPELTDQILEKSPEFSGQIYDWSALAKRSETYTRSPYTLFRSVCPGWDNTARKKNNASILVNNNPEIYESWLKNAVRETILYADDPDEKIVFVNAWNEWAEGAHLEPDIVNGYDYLEATRRAIEVRPSPPKIALIIHAFYPDILDEILSYLDLLPSTIELFVTTTIEKKEQIESKLKKYDNPFELLIVENKGRDVLPFINVFKKLVEFNFDYLIKVHTKKSLHRVDGAVWRQELYNSVLGVDAFSRSILALESDRSIGLIGPERHFVTMDTYIGSNQDRLMQFAAKLDMSVDSIFETGFFAGTMFIGRIQALEPLLRLGITDRDFEPEAGQIDGTLAHVIERVVSLCALSKRFRITFSETPHTDASFKTIYNFV